MIIDHTNLSYVEKWVSAKNQRFNGAYYYSDEIVRNIIPRVKTDRNWITINVPGVATQHTIVFIHDNMKPLRSYSWLSSSYDLVLVCGIEETMGKVTSFGTPIYLPLSVDVSYVEQFKTKKTKDVAYVGRPGKPGVSSLPKDIDFISGKRREYILPELAKYRKVYAVGRCAIEAKILGCEVLPYDYRYPDPSVWEILDNKDAAKMLQKQLDAIDKDYKSPGKVSVEAISNYYDKLLEEYIRKGDIFVVDGARCAQLVKKGLVDIVKIGV